MRAVKAAKESAANAAVNAAKKGAAWHRLSLRHTLLLVLLPGMLLVVAAELWLTWRTAVDAAHAAYDRSLLGAIKSIDANISTASGGLGVELPYTMLEFFELTASGQVFYRVATEDGLVEIGNADLPKPPRALQTGQPQFHEAAYYGEPVRVGSYARVLSPPLAGQPGGQRVVIQVAESLQSRSAFTRALVGQSMLRDAALVAVAAALLVFGVAWALRPLERLRAEVQARPPQDLAPVSASGLPADLRPLVEAINHHIERSRRLAEASRRFVDDTSHQLRTPLTTLATQVAFALRAEDPQAQREALEAIKTQLDESVRRTNQLLALARTDTAELALEALDPAALAEAVARDWWSAARDKGVDLGFEPPGRPLRVQAHAGLLKEALSNLLHNAVHYTPRGGQVTVRVRHHGDGAELSVADTGPGIPAQELARVGERFFRASNVALPGSGLGLAIVRSIAERHGGHMRVAAGADQRGLVVTLTLPLEAAPTQG